MNLDANRLSGFILQKDVYTTNILYENNLVCDSNLKNIVPFRPKSGRVPQDPTTCIQILKQICPIPLTTKNSNVFLFRNKIKTKKLKNKKWKFPLPKIRLRPISSNDFYKSIRGENIKTQNIEDDLNITSKHNKKIYFSYIEGSNNRRRDKYTEKYVNDEYYNNSNKKFDEFFDYGFHLKKNNNESKFNKKRIKSANKLKIKIDNILHKHIYPIDNTFKTQIDFNLLSKKNKKINTSKFQDGRNNNINLFMVTN